MVFLCYVLCAVLQLLYYVLLLLLYRVAGWIGSWVCPRVRGLLFWADFFPPAIPAPYQHSSAYHCSSGPLVKNSNLGLVLTPYRTSQIQYNFYDQFLTGRGERKASFLLCRISYLVGVGHALWLVKLHHASITCSLRHPILSLSILNVILFGAIYHRLLVKPHPASPQPLPADVVSTQRTKYKNHLTPMG